MVATVAKIRVLIADDHAIVRAGLIALLETSPDIEVVGEVADGQALFNIYLQLRPDVVLTDLRMPRLDGIAATEQIRRVDPHAKVILLTTFDDEEAIHRGLAAGASGYFLKDAACSDLTYAIRQVHQGRKAIAPRVAERLAERIGAREISEREHEVLQLVAEGLGNKQIALRLGIAIGTVKVHVASIMTKLDAQGRSEAVAIALRRGLIRLN